MMKPNEERAHLGRISLLFLLMLLGAHSATAENPITLDSSTDRPTYRPGEVLRVVVVATYGDGSPVGEIKKALTVIKDGERRRIARMKLTSSGHGNFTASHTIAEDTDEGSWQIKVVIEDVQRNKAVDRVGVTIAEGSTGCPDADGDGHDDATCGGDDCDDSDPTVHPGATETCGDGVDQDCSGGDLECGDPHGGLTWNGAATCIECHESEALEVHGSVMYQWQGDTPEMVNGHAPQGKISGVVSGVGWCSYSPRIAPDVSSRNR